MTDVEAVVKRFKTELYNCVGFIQEPKKLKESVKQLYQKYVQDDTVCQICVTHVKFYLLIWHRIWGKIVQEINFCQQIQKHTILFPISFLMRKQCFLVSLTPQSNVHILAILAAIFERLKIVLCSRRSSSKLGKLYSRSGHFFLSQRRYGEPRYLRPWAFHASSPHFPYHFRRLTMFPQQWLLACPGLHCYFFVSLFSFSNHILTHPISLQNESSASVDADIQREYSRQREHLERSVASLRKKLEKDNEIHRADNVRIMQVCIGS